MSRTKEVRWGCGLVYGAMAVIMVFMLGLFAERFSIVSHAQSEGKVTATVNIRKEASATSDALGSAMKDATVTINHQTKAADGTIWYQVFVDSDTLGYIRSDFVQITDGTTPPTQEAGAATTTPTATPVATPTPVVANETPAQVEALNPVSASVTGGSSVRVRSNASTTSQIVTTVQNGMALTVTGRANGTDGKVWYQVKFIANGAEVAGFVRSDFVSVSGEMVPATSEEPATEPEEPTGVEIPDEPVEVKDYETQLQGEDWYLINNVTGYQYNINDMFNAVTTNEKLYKEEHKKVNSQKIAIIIMVILMVVMAGGIAYLIFKIKDMMDSAYFSQVEKETIRRRGNERTQVGSQKVMHTVGVEKKRPNAAVPTQGGARPAGQKRPNGGAPTQGGARPAGQQRPNGGAPTQGGARPAGQQRPNGGVPTQGGARPAGQQRPNGGAPAQGGARPAGQQHPNGGAAPVQGGARPAGQKRPNTAAPAQGKPTPNPGWKSKNFMQDDDEFEFEFLNWDGEEDL